ncbi:sigma-70 family RNA polymerase sigma factor [Paraconexibacter algicola]|nr:sigma-70 family RNA polymerase sigma factor [Paraconexibacter algicola]
MDTATTRRIELELLRRYAEHGDFAARDEVIERTMSLVHFVARRYVDRGLDYDELVQVGSIGLVKAVDRFDHRRQHAFASFAIPNIAGEIRRHFRDHGQVLRAPRDVQEKADMLRTTTDRLVSRLQRQPSTDEVALAAGMTLREVLDVQAAVHRSHAAYLDEPVREDEDAQSRLDRLGTIEEGYEQVEARAVAADGLDTLRNRERRIVALRFDEGLTQTEIAERVGMSQMHVSRLLRQALDDIREVIENPALGA